MEAESRKSKFLFVLEFTAWLLAIAVLAYHLMPVLGGKLLAGWDMPGHYYLYNLMLSYLEQGKISGYDPHWYAGYPAFTLYPPLSYIVLGLPHLISFGALSPLQSYNLVIFLLPFLFLLVLRWSGAVYFGNKSGLLFLVFGLLYLLLGVDYAHFNLGIAGLLLNGLPTGNIALIFMTALLGVVELNARRFSIARSVLAAILLAAILLSHLLTALFTCWLLVLFALMRGRRGFYTSAAAIGGGAALGSFWLIPFFRHLPFSSGKSIGLLLEMFRDPLLILYPGVTASRLLAPWVGGEPARSFILQGDQSGAFLVEISEALISFPYYGLMLFVGSIAGIVILFRRREWFLPGAFLASLILLPREYLAGMFDMGVHYYRFLQHIFLLNIFLACCGWQVLIIRAAAFNSSLFRFSAVAFVFIVFAISTIMSAVFQLDWHNVAPHSRAAPTGFDFGLTLDEYKEASDAGELISYIHNLDVRGRVAIEASPTAMFRYGSPRLFSSLLPLSRDIEVVPGLLAESALSAGFINPTLAVGGRHYVWGRERLIGEEDFRSQSVESMLSRLGLYGVQYIVATTSDYAAALNGVNADLLVKVKRIGSFTVFELKGFRRRLAHIGYKPFLFVDRGGMDFRSFSEEWFKHPELFNRPVIYSEKPYAELPKDERERIGGIIVSCSPDRELNAKEIAEWQALGKRLVFLNAERPQGTAITSRPRFFPAFHQTFVQQAFVSYMLSLREERSPEKLSFIDRGAERLIFEAEGGVIINYNYAPGWQSSNSNQTVYMATPSVMFIFSNDRTVLRYD